MEDQLTFNDQTKPALPSTLNVLTILTFVWSGISILLSLSSPLLLKFSRTMMEKATSSGQEFTTKQLEDMEKGRQAVDLAQANLIPSMIAGVIAAVLCIVGAIMMRKLKKDGLWIYLAGEILPLIVAFLLMGTKQFTGIWSVLIAVAFPVLFIILYLTQQKVLIK